MRTSKRNFVAPLLLIVINLCCGRGSDERVYLAAIEVINTTDRQIFKDGELLEIEVHIFESDTRRFIACSGQDHGLRKVDQSGVLYQVEARFRKPNGRDLQFQEVEPLRIHLEVFEDDFDACPQQPASGDDLVGASPPFPGSELQFGKVLSFGNVAHLQIMKGKEGAQSVIAPAL